MSSRPRLDSLSSYDDLWLPGAHAALAMPGGEGGGHGLGDGHMPKLDPGIFLGSGSPSIRPMVKSDGIKSSPAIGGAKDDRHSKLTPNLTPALLAQNYLHDMSPLVKPLGAPVGGSAGVFQLKLGLKYSDECLDWLGDLGITPVFGCFSLRAAKCENYFCRGLRRCPLVLQAFPASI